MLHLLHIEWLKLKYYRTFWILVALFALSLFGVNYIVFEVQREAFSSQGAMAASFLGNPPFRFPEVWQTVCFISSFLLFFPGLIIIILMTNEFSFKTHRQNIIDGLSRMEFIMVKVVLAAIVALASACLVMLVAVFFGLREGSASFTLANGYYLVYYFIQALSYTMLALLCAVIFRRSGISIGVYFLYAVVLEEALVRVTSYYLGSISQYLPLQSNDNLIPFPLFKSMVGQLITYPDALPMLITAAVYLALYVFICRYRFQKADL